MESYQASRNRNMRPVIRRSMYINGPPIYIPGGRLRPPPPPGSDSESDPENYWIAAYYPNWRIYKQQPPSSLRLDRVSHLFYAFAGVGEDGTVYLTDGWADEKMPIEDTEGCIRAFTELGCKYQHMHVMLSIGGGGVGSHNFAAVAANPTALERFVETAKGMVDRFELDGLDIDWEHPSDPQQGKDYIKLLASVRAVLPFSKYALTSALPAGEWALKHIDLSAAQSHLDFINLMTYDFSGPWAEKSGHHSQLFTPERPHNHAAALSCNSAVSYMLSRGVPSKKILLGIPTYGRGFPKATNIGQYIPENMPELKNKRLKTTSDHDDNQNNDDSDANVFDYADLPLLGTDERHDSSVGNAAYCVDFKKNGFVTYDSPQSVREKARFVKKEKLGGLFYWHIASDAKEESRSLIETGSDELFGS